MAKKVVASLQKRGAKDFMFFLQSDFVKKKIRDYGYEVD